MKNKRINAWIMNRMSISLFITFTLLFFACEGDKGDPGPQGADGEKGVAGSDGEQGKDGNTTAFYFQNGLNDYDGTVDVTIYNNSELFMTPPTADSERLYAVRWPSASDPTLVDSVTTVIRFDNIVDVVMDEYDNTFCAGDFSINHAILYISGVYLTGERASYLQTGIYGAEAPLFSEGQANWSNASNSEPWPATGGEAIWTYNHQYLELADVENPGYVTMLNDGSDVNLMNHMPVFIPVETIRSWLCEEGGNKGLRFGVILQDAQVVIFSSENEEPNLRPMLYFNMIKADNTGRSALLTTEEALAQWNSKSYEEKMEPFYTIYPDTK